MKRKKSAVLYCGMLLFLVELLLTSGSGFAHAQAAGKQPQLVWVDTDIGDDIDDAFALGLILKTPEMKVLGVSTAFGDTEMRARLTSRFLSATGNGNIPVTAGVHTNTSNVLSQASYAEHWPKVIHGDGVAAMLAAIRKNPGQVTLIAIGPLFNIGAAIDLDAATFRKVKRVVIMGGAVRRGYGAPDAKPVPEWNILQDPKGAAKLFASGVPLFVMPLDSTQIQLPESERDKLFAAGTPLTDQITLLYHQWFILGGNRNPTPTLFDPVAVAYAIDPALCPMQPMRIEVDPNGLTREVEGKPNAQVCLKSDENAFFQLLLGRLRGEGK